jgi:hypothetical protein
MHRRLLQWAFALLAALAWAGLPAGKAIAAEDEWAKSFLHPPAAARPWAYWWWLDSFATKEGITKDLEEMKRQGIGGVLIFDAGEGGPDAPKGPLFMSPPWRELFKFAVAECDRLGIEASINLCSGWDAGGPWVTPPHAAKKLVFAETRVQGPTDFADALPQPPVVDRFYREIAVVAFKENNRRGLAPQAPGEPARKPPGLKHWEYKSANKGFWNDPPQNPSVICEEYPETAGEQDAEAAEVVDLSKQMDEGGRLRWRVPEGTWTVQRFGCTLLGQKTRCTSPAAIGYEIDPFSAEAMDMHFAATAEKLIADVGPLSGRALKHLHIDSYELGSDVGGQQPTWTDSFRAEFQTRRGYDLLPYLPVLARRIVTSRQVSNRFLWDYRRTIADLFAEKYYGHFRDLAHRHQLRVHPESGYGSSPFPHIDGLQCAGMNDIPMGEFWKRQTEPAGHVVLSEFHDYCDVIRTVVSAAHIYGKRVVQAEAFTSMGPNWEEDPFMLKDIGDAAFCAGLNRNVLCFYVHQPRLDLKPGSQWEAAGTHFDRNITWWDQSQAWLAYLARCQHLLQQGLFVADVCYFYGEDVPNFVPAKTKMKPPLPPGYDCDTINADALLNRLRVKNGRLVLPDGLSYRLLVLPESRAVSPAVLRKIKNLVENGATAVGPKPERASGLTGYPQCDAEVRKLADEVWGEVDGTKLKERRVGQGRIVWGKSLAEILASQDAPPDFEPRNAAPAAKLDFIHRVADGAELYFVSNQQNRPEKADCLFRVAGKRPEFWDAVTGAIRPATDFHQEGSRALVPMEFAPRQSWFVVFRQAGGEPETRRRNFPALVAGGELGGPWTVKFDPQWGGPESVQFAKLEDWTKRSEPGIRYYSGKAVYQQTFDLPAAARTRKAAGQKLLLDLGRVQNVAEVRLNGTHLGVVWTAPWQVEVTGVVKPSGNTLEIGVVNLWPNRLIGDAALPPERRFTHTNVKKFKPNSPLLESGLLGPVLLRVEE